MGSDYRPDVDGLRAVAVSAVLLFHAFPTRFPGGFVGVDIFFIISGFLISGIIFKGLERGNFSFLDFYSRRVRRIFPALILVFVACLIFGWLALIPAEFRQLGKHVLGGSAFSSNFVLLLESGYFDSEATRKPLRHLWSLGVEEQYYLIWPVLLFLCRNSQRYIKILLATLGLSSFAFNIYLTNANQSMAYYLPLTRFWELMVGSGLAYLVRHRDDGGNGMLSRWNSMETDPRFGAKVAGTKAILGVIAIALSLYLINERRAFPGWWALLVCAGAALIIWAGGNTWINRRILASRPFVWVGLISYPLYLWHWPLLSFANIVSVRPSIPYRFAALLASVALAYLTYLFLELPIRRARTTAQTRRTTLRLVQAMTLVAMIGGLAGWQIFQPASAGDPKVVKISEATRDWADMDDHPIVPGSVKTTVLFFGDSHMEQYWPRIELLARQAQPRRSIDFFTLGGCAPIPGIERRGFQCGKFVADGFARAAQPDVDTVVLAAQWSGLGFYNDYYLPGKAETVSLDVLAPENRWIFDRFAATLTHLHQLGKRVVVLLSSPRGDAFDPNLMLNRTQLVPHARQVSAVSRAELTLSLAPIDSRIRAAAESAGAEILDPKDWFCDGPVCPVVDSTGRPISKDGSHIRASLVRTQVTALDAYVLLVTGAKAH